MTNTADADLRRLASLLGIQSSWTDVFGNDRPVPSETLRALLRAVDVDTATPKAIREAITRHDVEEWDQEVPPVIVIEADRENWCLPINTAAGNTAIEWMLVGEAGERITGTFDFGSQVHGDTTATVDGVQMRSLQPLVANPLSPGYYRLSLSTRPHGSREVEDTLVIAVPARAQAMTQEGRGKVWGPAVQLYALQSAANWGIGDWSDLARLVGSWAALGADVVGLNPMHALFASEPEHASPYSPSSRRWLNPIYLDVTAVDGFSRCSEAQARIASSDFQRRLQSARGQQLVDYTAVWQLKREILELLHAAFCRHGNGMTLDDTSAFAEFRRAGGEALRRHAVFEALDAHFRQEGSTGHGWLSWPTAFHDPESLQVHALADQLRSQVNFFEFLQWQADVQLSRAQQLCKSRGMGIGLYLDMAVSVDAAGSDTWGHSGLFAREVGIGAPPDEFNPKGQGWGLATLRPDRLREDRHRFFIETVRGVMQYGGAVRIDHVMGLMRLFWVPAGCDASKGAYVHLPFEELLGIIILESIRSGAVVVGEDLGTVDPAVQQALAVRGVLSYRLVYFEKKSDGSFKAPHEYPAQALAAISTHDLPTLSGWWGEHDLDIRRELKLFPDEFTHHAQRRDRACDRERLVEILVQAGLLTDDAAESLEPLGATPPSSELVAAVHGFLGATSSKLVMVQLEDLIGIAEQANLPGTTTAYPNWRRKLQFDIDEANANGTFEASLGSLRRNRAEGNDHDV